MKEGNQAVPPTMSGIDFVREMRASEKQADTNPDELRDREVAYVASTPGWQHIQQRIQRRIDSLRGLTDVDNLHELDRSEIGERFLIASVASKELDDLLHFVTSKAKYFEDKDEKQEPAQS